MIGSVPRARRMHRRALRFWAQGRHEAAQQRAMTSLTLLRRELQAGRGTALDQVAVLLTLADFFIHLATRRQVVDFAQQAVTLLHPTPRSRERDRWLTDTLVRLGDAQRLAACYAAAETTLREAFTLADSSDLEPQRRASTRNALGILAKDTGRYAQARAYYTDALAILEPVVGSDSPQLADLHHNLAGLGHAQGEYTEAEHFARRALELRRRGQEPHPTEIAADTCVLAAILAGQGRHDEAEPLLRDSLQTWTSRFGPNHYEVAVNLHNLAAIQHARGDYRSAEDTLQAALQIKTRLLSDSHPEIVALQRNLGALYEEQGRSQEAGAATTLPPVPHMSDDLKIFWRNRPRPLQSPDY